MVRNLHINMAYYPGTVSLRCPNCNKSYHRRYKEHDNGFGFCNNCPDVKLVKTRQMLDDKKLDKIKLELQGHVTNRGNRSSIYT